MIRILAVIMWFTLCSLNAFPQHSEAGATTTSFLLKFRADYLKAVREGKTDILAAYYDDAIRLMPEFQKTIISKEKVLRYGKAYASRFIIREFVRQEIEVMDLGERVIEFGTFSQKLTLRSSNENFELTGKYCDIWQRDSTGKLTLVTQAWNYAHQIDFARHLIFDEVPTVNIALQAHVPVNSAISFELAAFNRFQESVVSEHDAARWKLFYTDDYMFFYSGSPVYRGRKEVDAFLEEHVKHLPVFEKLDIRTDRIDALGQYVIEYASHIAVVRSGDWSVVATGKDIRIWRREPGGFLRICRGVAMYD